MIRVLRATLAANFLIAATCLALVASAHSSTGTTILGWISATMGWAAACSITFLNVKKG